MPFLAAHSHILAVQWRKWRSGSYLAGCRRVYANTVARLVFAAEYLRIFARKSRNLVARLVFPAVHFGDNSAHRAHLQVI